MLVTFGDRNANEEEEITFDMLPASRGDARAAKAKLRRRTGSQASQAREQFQSNVQE